MMMIETIANQFLSSLYTGYILNILPRAMLTQTTGESTMVIHILQTRNWMF